MGLRGTGAMLNRIMPRGLGPSTSLITVTCVGSESGVRGSIVPGCDAQVGNRTERLKQRRKVSYCDDEHRS